MKLSGIHAVQEDTMRLAAPTFATLLFVTMAVGGGAAEGMDVQGYGGFDVQGHRGFAGRMPENSMPAFRAALELGVTTLELDLQATKDRVLVVHHDQHLNPGRCVDAHGSRVAKTHFVDLTLDGLAGIDCGYRETADRPAVAAPIPTLDEVLALARDADYPVRLSLEIKAQKLDRALPLDDLAALLVDRIREFGLEDRTIVQSFQPQALTAVRGLEPRLARAILARSPARYDVLVDESAATILSPRHTALSEEDVRRFQERGIAVIPWTVNKPAAIERMIEWGVDGIISDHPDRVLDALKRTRAAD
jgi:glycerophosphoryl diester phosphodiesterase